MEDIRELIKMTLKLINRYRADIDLAFEQIMVLQSILNLDDLRNFDNVKSAEKVAIQHTKISKPTEIAAIFNKSIKVTKDEIRQDLWKIASTLNKKINLIEKIECRYKQLPENYKILFTLIYINEYSNKTKFKYFMKHFNSDCKINNVNIMKKKYNNMKFNLLLIFINDKDIVDAIQNLG